MVLISFVCLVEGRYVDNETIILKRRRTVGRVRSTMGYPVLEFRMRPVPYGANAMTRTYAQFAILLWCFLSAASFAGAWGTGTFENDDALDFVWEIQDEDTPALLSSPFRYAFHSDGYIDAYLGARILVAAEAYAALKGNPSSQLPDDLASWLASKSWNPDKKLTKTAEDAVKMVLDSDTSELARLWLESPDDHKEWVKGVEDLLKRLR